MVIRARDEFLGPPIICESKYARSKSNENISGADAELLGQEHCKNAKPGTSAEKPAYVVGANDVCEMQAAVDDIHGECVGTGHIFFLTSERPSCAGSQVTTTPWPRNSALARGHEETYLIAAKMFTPAVA